MSDIIHINIEFRKLCYRKIATREPIEKQNLLIRFRSSLKTNYKKNYPLHTHTHKRKKRSFLNPIANDRVNSRTPATSHRLEANMMNAETALWGTFTPARALGQGGVDAARGGSWRGGVVRHSANVTYCLFRGGCTRLHVARWTRGWWEQLTLGSHCPRRYSHNRKVHPPPSPSPPPPHPSRSPLPTDAYVLFTTSEHMGCCNQYRRWSWLIVLRNRDFPLDTLFH